MTEGRKMNYISDFNGIADYIESHLDQPVSVEKMAEMAKMSVYEFRRIFSFAAGISVSEYLRRRRLSAAAEELLQGKKTVTELAQKYGYETSAPFPAPLKNSTESLRQRPPRGRGRCRDTQKSALT